MQALARCRVSSNSGNASTYAFLASKQDEAVRCSRTRTKKSRMAKKSKKPIRALLVIDLQNDFVSGALAVKDAAEIIPLVDQLIQQDFDVKVATKDWHPRDHGSFAANHSHKKVGEKIQLQGISQILWPVHCVQDSPGAEFAPGWKTNALEHIVYKGTDSKLDSYSGFFDNQHRRATGLEEYLKQRGVTDVYVVGLATDYCVQYSALDARELGFNTFVITDACRAVNLKSGDSQKALKAMAAAGVHIVTMDDL